MTNFEGTSVYNVIYIYGIADTSCQGQLNVGVASVNYNGCPENLEPNCKFLNKAATEIIARNNGDGSAAVLEYAALAVQKCGNKRIGFGKAELQEWLVGRGFKHPDTITGNVDESNDWFVADRQSLIDAVKQFCNKGECDIAERDADTANTQNTGITLREEQLQAVEQTLACFKRGKKMLWDAKMRFGKTLCALEVVKRSTFRRTLILTHRPMVREGWFDDFEKVGFTDCLYGSKAQRRHLTPRAMPVRISPIWNAAHVLTRISATYILHQCKTCAGRSVSTKAANLTRTTIYSPRNVTCSVA